MRQKKLDKDRKRRQEDEKKRSVLPVLTCSNAVFFHSDTNVLSVRAHTYTAGVQEEEMTKCEAKDGRRQRST